MLKSARRPRFGLGNDRRSVAALEFALVAPVMLLFFFGVYDLSDGMITYEEVFNAARVIPSSVSNVSVQTDSTTKLYYSQIQLQASAIFAQMPTVRSGFHTGIKSITISAIDFEQVVTSPACTPGVNCTYLPYVVWSVAYTGANTGRSFATALRGCANQQSGSTTVLDTASAQAQTAPNGGIAGDLTSLRTSAITSYVANGNPPEYPAAPDPIIVVDVHYQYVPVFNLFIKHPVDFWADGYWPLRSVQATQLNPNTGVFTPVATDAQYTGLVATGTNTNGVITGPYAIQPGNVYPAGWTLAANAPVTSTYCISPYYPEPQT